MKKTYESKPANRDATRDKWGVKAKRRDARKAKNKRRAFESGSKGWK